jgi:nucleoside-diphosphate-sugar epimerase
VPIPPRTIRRVLILGAGGPLGAVAAENLARDHHLRLADHRPLAEVAAGPPQSPGAPLARPLAAPHEERPVDVTDQSQVVAAAEGMDAILNLAVMRRDPVEAFRVNLLGAHNLMVAADVHDIRRVVHTGPVQMILDHPAGYGADFHLPENAPSRPGDDLYFLSKFLGQELVRIVAEERGHEVPCLLFGNFVDPATSPPPGYRLWSFTLSWADAGEALARAIRTPAFPRPFQVLHPNADLPHGRYPNVEAKRLLGWQPRDRLETLWRR